MAGKSSSRCTAGPKNGRTGSDESSGTKSGGVLRRVREELNNNIDLPTRDGAHRFFKEDVKLHGVKTAIVHGIAKKYFKEIKHLGKEEIFSLCEDLYRSDYLEEASIASAWSHELRKSYEITDFKRFEGWIEQYINNWAKCDVFCNHTIGSFVEQFPDFTEKLRLWSKSDNRWMRRAAAVSLIVPARRGKFLDVVFEIADLLLEDEDDLVQKGYGWMLKEASRLHQKEVFDYVVRNRSVMPRTALRYAIEKMPETLRKEAMKK